MKQTAVEWLVEQFTTTVFYSKEAEENTIKQALEMEKEQIRNAYCKGEQDFVNNKVITSEQYYNETFKK
jgi:hypothetical protein